MSSVCSHSERSWFIPKCKEGDKCWKLWNQRNDRSFFVVSFTSVQECMFFGCRMRKGRYTPSVGSCCCCEWFSENEWKQGQLCGFSFVEQYSVSVSRYFFFISFVSSSTKYSFSLYECLASDLIYFIFLRVWNITNAFLPILSMIALNIYNLPFSFP